MIVKPFFAWFVAALCAFPLGGYTLSQTQPVQTPSDEWAGILRSWRSERNLITSLEVQYTLTLRFDPPMPVSTKKGRGRCARTEYRCEYGRAGIRFFQKATMESFDTEGHNISGTTKLEASYDGKHAMGRNEDLPHSVQVASSPQLLAQTLPDPLELAVLLPPEDTERLLSEGTVRVVSVQPGTVEGRNAQVVRVLFVSTGYHVSTWYVPSQGWVPMKSQETDEAGTVTREGRVTKLVSLDAGGGNTVFVPAAYELRSFRLGVWSTQKQLLVDQASIRVNAPIAETRFKLQLRPEDRVRDVELQIDLPNPGDTERGIPPVPAATENSAGVLLPSDEAEGHLSKGAGMSLPDAPPAARWNRFLAAGIAGTLVGALLLLILRRSREFT